MQFRPAARRSSPPRASTSRAEFRRGTDTDIAEGDPRLSDPEARRARTSKSFCVIFLDNRHRVIEFVELFRGTIDGASVHPREVVKEALQRNAAAVIFAHPHPSGVAEPSHADELITAGLAKPLQLVDIRVLDHIIVAGGETISFAEKGLL